MLCRYKDKPTYIRPLAHSITRRGIWTRYKQPPVSYPEVMFTCRHLTLVLNVSTFTDACVITQGRAAEVSGLLCDIISKCWLCTRVSDTLLNVPAQMHTYSITMQSNNIPRFLFCIPSGLLLRSRDVHHAEYLCRGILFLAAIQSTAQTRRCNLS